MSSAIAVHGLRESFGDDLRVARDRSSHSEEPEICPSRHDADRGMILAVASAAASATSGSTVV